MNMYNWNSPPTINGQTQKGHPTELMRNGKDTLVFYLGNSWGVWEGRGQGRNTDPPLSKINNLACSPLIMKNCADAPILYHYVTVY